MAGDAAGEADHAQGPTTCALLDIAAVFLSQLSADYPSPAPRPLALSITTHTRTHEYLLTLQRTAEKIKDPMFRFFEREVTIGVKLLKQVIVAMPAAA